MRATPRSAPVPPAFVSHQVTEASRYYLELNPSRKAGIIVVCGGWERLQPEYRVARKTFPYHCVEFVAEGTGMLTLNGRDHSLRPGTVFAYAPGIAHLIRNDPARPMRKYYVDFVGREAIRLLQSTLLGRWEPAQIASPHELTEIFEALQRDALEEGALSAELCAAHLRVLLLKLGQRALPPGKAEPRALATYQRARRHLEQHFVTLRTAEEWAQACHLTPVHLSRVFRRFARSTPYLALMRCKMNRAAELLLDGGLLVKEVAEVLHFSSAFQFSRAFKRTFGVSPDHFARHHAEEGRGSRRPLGPAD